MDAGFVASASAETVAQTIENTRREMSERGESQAQHRASKVLLSPGPAPDSVTGGQ